MSKEIAIINSVLDGETDSFKILVERYQNPVLSLINGIIADTHTSCDIAQDVFFTAYRKLGSFDPARSRFSTWLFTIARNKAINALKKKKPLTTPNPPERIDHNTPPANLTRKEAFQILDNALKTLPLRYKTALVLAEFQNLPYHQIAQIEGISLGTVKSRVHRARKKLAQTLKKYTGDLQWTPSKS